MEQYFDNEIKNMERELLYLKTASQKSASAIKTISKTVSVSANLEYQDISWPTGSARANKWYKVTTSDDAIIIPTLSWYHGDVTQAADIEYVTRKIQMATGIIDGNFTIGLYFVGTEKGDNSDAARTKRGETVTVTVDLTVLCTQDFQIQEVNP
jgi:hypothetical protein